MPPVRIPREPGCRVNWYDQHWGVFTSIQLAMVIGFISLFFIFG